MEPSRRWAVTVHSEGTVLETGEVTRLRIVRSAGAEGSLATVAIHSTAASSPRSAALTKEL